MDKSQVQVNTVKPEVSFFEDETLNRIINFDREMSLDSRIKSLEDFINLNPGHGLDEIAKDTLYGQAQEFHKNYKTELMDVKFNFYLNRPQYNLLTDILLKKTEYDVNTLFIAIELTEMLGNMSGSKYNNDTELKVFELTATELTYVYHLIQTYKVKGLTKEAYIFSKVLIRIGEVSKLINYYDTYAKNLVEDIKNWALRMDASDVPGNVVQGELVGGVTQS